MRASALRVQDGGGPGDGTRALRRGRAGLQPAGPRTAPGGSGTEDRAGGERALEGGARGRRNREQGQVRPAGTASLSLTPPPPSLDPGPSLAPGLGHTQLRQPLGGHVRRRRWVRSFDHRAS